MIKVIVVLMKFNLNQYQFQKLNISMRPKELKNKKKEIKIKKSPIMILNPTIAIRSKLKNKKTN
jgi:hypothetical protein